MLNLKSAQNSHFIQLHGKNIQKTHVVHSSFVWWEKINPRRCLHCSIRFSRLLVGRREWEKIKTHQIQIVRRMGKNTKTHNVHLTFKIARI